MSNRRDFLKTFAASAAGISLTGIPHLALAKHQITKITILHTNDVHSHIDPFPANDPKYPGLGGVAQRAAIINDIRNREPNVLLFDAGDIFQGTPYFNFYGGEIELKLMSQMGYDAGTIGNHDFDHGVEGLAAQLKNATFPLICCNYNFKKTPMAGKTVPYKVFEKSGVLIGVFGLGIELQGLVDKKMYGETVYNDPLENAAIVTHHLKYVEKCDLIICLSHLGYKYKDDKVSDEILAKKSLNIDLIIGGHTHTFINKPYIYKNRDGKDVLVAQVGWAGIKLGRIDFFVNKKSRKLTAESTTLKVFNYASVI
ncbi:MAG: metallophosphoesterase [Bacteroidetes bacterium]|jgi:5'-nucleotidase|nr:metallophosphoesterase [Bacteroidota bacterium]